MRFLLTVAAVVALTGCASSEEKMCKANITESLINPETGEFYDFKMLPADADLKTLWRRVIVEEQGIRLHYNNYNVVDQLQQVVDERIRVRQKLKFRYASYRVKAESRFGLKVTKDYLCWIQLDNTCHCGVLAE